MTTPTIVIAGASGYIGRALIPYLLQKFPDARIVALSRSQQNSADPRVQWKACDLFSITSVEEALPSQVDLALYLVHSMGPTAQLDQGSFADYDLLLADNFARAISKTRIEQMIYLGGLIPEHRKLSLHLQSRLEVEETFRQYELPLTVFRAGLILGEAGSSYQILLKLVKRLPLMICPRWTQTLTTPVDLPTVLTSITEAALNSAHINQVYDLAGCQPLTYLEMMNETALRLGKKRHFFAFPFLTPTLSRLWVCLITNSPKALVYPLIQSLEHPMLARENHLFSQDWRKISYQDLLQHASVKSKAGQALFRFRATRKTVRSVQRLPLPEGKDAEWVKNHYTRWLPRFLLPLIRVRQEGTITLFTLLRSRLNLLELQLNDARSNADWQMLSIMKGILVADKHRGRLEFRVVLNRRYVLAAIHDYKPSLPWFIYKFTQANLHLNVMHAFRRYLIRLSRRQVND